MSAASARIYVTKQTNKLIISARTTKKVENTKELFPSSILVPVRILLHYCYSWDSYNDNDSYIDNQESL